MNAADVVVIGGGVVGSSIAFHLIEDGFRGRVGVVERDSSYSRSSSHLAMGGIRQQFGSALNIQMVQHSIPFWRDFDRRMSVRGHGSRANFRQRGYLFLVGHDQASAFEQRMKLQLELGAKVERLESSELARRYPGVRLDDIAFGVMGAEDGYASPREVTKSFRFGAEAAGATFVEGEVTAIERSEGGGAARAANASAPAHVTGVVLASGERIVAPVVVDAAGPWAGAVARMAGIELPISPQRQHLFRCALPSPWPYRLPMMIDPSGVHWRHDDPDHVSDLDRIVVAYTRRDEPAGENFACDDSRWEREFAPPLLARMPGFRGLRVIEGWVGLYEMTPDHNPVIGEHPDLAGFCVAAGFSGHGLMMSPATGKVMSEIIREGRATSVDVTPLAADRFARGALFHDGAML
jgi:FAD-dependent oxidoreductase domain-containing protein 1